MWAEPHNNNPLEKTTLSRQGITAQSKEMKDETAVRLCLDMLAPEAFKKPLSNEMFASHICRGHMPHASLILEGSTANTGLAVHAALRVCTADAIQNYS